MGLLGWRLTSNPKKIQRFGTVFDMLGVTIDLSKVPEGVVTVENKKSRIEAMSTAIGQALSRDGMTAHEASSLKGKLSFMDNQCFARLGVMTTRALGGRSLGSSQELPLSPELRDSLMWSLDLMSHSIGREISLKRLERQ
eukprot:1690958-Amphidinium_carterae.1